METQERIVAGISRSVEALGARLAERDAAERAHMRARCSPQAAQALEGMSVQSLHLLERIPAASDGGSEVNVSGLSLAAGIPKGTASKLLQRMASSGVVHRYRKEGNRKEVLLRLTEIGEEIQDAHRSLHREMGAVAEGFLSRYTRDELQVISRVLGDLVRMPSDGLRYRPDLLD